MFSVNADSVDTLDIAALVCSYTALFAYFVSLGYACWKYDIAWLKIPSFTDEQWIAARDASQTTNESKKVAELIESRLMRRARLFIFGGAPVVAACLIFLIVAKSLDWDSTSNTESSPFLLAGLTPLMILAVTTALICLCCKAQPVKITRAMVHTLIVCLLAWNTIFYQNGQNMLFDRPYTLIGRLTGVLVFGSFRDIIILNVFAAVVNICVWAEMQSAPDLELLCGGAWDCMQWFVVQEISVGVLIVILGVISEVRVRAEAAATAKAISSQNIQGCLCGLLETVYDVVFELDEALHFVDSATALACLLLHGAGRQFKGTSLMDYMLSETDKSKFLEHLQDDQARGNAVPVRLRMRDSDGSSIHVELLHSTFNAGDSIHHLIGAREVESNLPAFDADLEQPSFQTQAVINNEQGSRTRGTPAKAMTESLPDLSDTQSNASGRSSSTRLLSSRFAETPKSMQISSMMKLLLKWNITASQSFCCSHHLLVFQARTALSRLQAGPCFESDEIFEECTWQCENCKMVDEPQMSKDGRTMTCHWCQDGKMTCQDRGTDSKQSDAKEPIVFGRCKELTSDTRAPFWL